MAREAIADRIIQDHAFYATVGGCIPLPLLDVAAEVISADEFEQLKGEALGST